MPILAAYPVVDVIEEIDQIDQINRDAEFRETRGFAFRSLDGEQLLPFTGNEFIARWGIQNLDVPARQVVEELIPQQDGSDLIDIKIGSRAYAIPIFVGSNSGHLDYLRNRARMRSFFNHRGHNHRANAGTFDLVAVSVLGERSLRSTYIDGMNGQWDQETSGSYWETFGLQALAVNPYWNGGRWSSEVIRRPEVGAAWFWAFPPQLSPANLLNTGSTVLVEGDVESWPLVTAIGPCTGLLITGGDLILDVPEGLADGETLLLDTDPRNKRVLFDGVEDWTRLSPLSIQAPLPVGVQELELTLPDPGAGTQVQISGTKWFETPW